MGPTSYDCASVSAAGAGAYMNTQSVAAAPSTTVSTGGVDPTTASASSGFDPLSGVASSSLTGSAAAVQSQVDTLLASFGSEVAGNQFLRMIIALLILNALLGKQDDEHTSKASQLAGLAGGLNSLGRSADYAMFSETNVIQIQHQSTLVYTDQALQSAGGGEATGGGSTGPRLDVNA